MKNQPTVSFPGNCRIHIGIAVSDLERSKQFYETLLGIQPSKERPGYVKFEPQDPSINLTLNEIRSNQSASRSTTHYGIQVKSSAEVRDAHRLFCDAGLEPTREEQTTCCYAVQDKVWVTDPDGNQWEVFVVLESDADRAAGTQSACCQNNESGSATGAACC